MYIYVHIYIYTHTIQCIYIYICSVSLFIYIYTNTRVCVFIYIYIHDYIHTFARDTLHRHWDESEYLYLVAGLTSTLCMSRCRSGQLPVVCDVSCGDLDSADRDFTCQSCPIKRLVGGFNPSEQS